MTAEMNSEMGKRVRECRETFGYTREQFAEKLGISVRFAADIELGTSGMSIDTLIKICELFSVSADYIIWGRGDYTSNVSEHLLNGMTDSERKYAEEILKLYAKSISEVRSKKV